MSKIFHWKDLEKVIEKYDKEGVISREGEALRTLLQGQNLDLATIPKRDGFRSVKQVQNKLRKTLSKHSGVVHSVEHIGDVWFIPELRDSDGFPLNNK